MTRHRDKAALFVAKNTAPDVKQLARQMARVEERRAASHFHTSQGPQPVRPLTAKQLHARFASEPHQAPMRGDTKELSFGPGRDAKGRSNRNRRTLLPRIRLSSRTRKRSSALVPTASQTGQITISSRWSRRKPWGTRGNNYYKRVVRSKHIKEERFYSHLEIYWSLNEKTRKKNEKKRKSE